MNGTTRGDLLRRWAAVGAAIRRRLSEREFVALIASQEVLSLSSSDLDDPERDRAESSNDA